ncbi:MULTISPECIES: hypothetical protein [unclassified Ruminococcus]|uniref:hypothetical protein n=1 Tax=unclassified Ruminococcus TaxID=2608920 RepID=UPI00319DB1B2
MSNILSLENFNKALARKKWDLKRLANEYDKKYPSENGRTIYNTLRRWRSPNGNPTLNILVRVCDLLECDIDYLLGRIEESTHTIKFIQEKTGLSETSQKRLQEILQTPSYGEARLFILNNLIENIRFSIALTDDIKSCYNKYSNLQDKKEFLERYERIIYSQTQGDIIKEMNIRQSLPDSPLISNSKQQLTNARDSYDASLFRIQGKFGNIINDLIQTCYEQTSNLPNTKNNSPFIPFE